MTPSRLFRDIRSLPAGRQLVLLLLPLAFLGASLFMRHSAGHFWLWSNLDPDYWYLTDSLNMVNGAWPKHVGHPGTTLQWIGALMIKGLHPFMSAEDITRLVLTHPEQYLLRIWHVLLTLNTAALILVGMVGYLVFRDLTTALLLQTGPFLSKLIFKWTLHVAPEPLLVTTVCALAIVTILALREGEIEKNRYRYALAFAVIAGFGMATKVTSAGMYLLPIILLWNLRAIVLYGIVSAIALVVFTLPAAGSYGLMLDWFTMISSASGHFGHGSHSFIDPSTYPKNLIRISGRPIFFIVLVAGLGLIVAVFRRCRQQGRPFPVVGRAMGGLCLAFVGQALLVAKHPSGHYMIPALTASAFGLALIYQLSKALGFAEGRGLKRLSQGFTLLLLILIGAQANSLIGLNREFAERTAHVKAIDETPYRQCARIYYWPASDPLYALFMGSWNTKYSFYKDLDALYPDKSVMYFTNDGELHDLQGLRDPAALPGQYPCIYMRGERPDGSLQVFYDAFASYAVKGRCHSGEESIFTWGIDCQSGK